MAALRSRRLGCAGATAAPPEASKATAAYQSGEEPEGLLSLDALAALRSANSRASASSGAFSTLPIASSRSSRQRS